MRCKLVLGTRSYNVSEFAELRMIAFILCGVLAAVAVLADRDRYCDASTDDAGEYPRAG